MRIATNKNCSVVTERVEKRPRLGGLLFRVGAVTEEVLGLALEHHSRKGVRIGEALMQLNIITEEVMRKTLCAQLKIPFIPADAISVDPVLSKVINRNYAKKHGIVPIAKVKRTLTLIMDDPTDEALIEELETKTGFRLNVVTSTRAGLGDAFKRVYEGIQERRWDSAVQLIHEEDHEPEKVSSYLESDEVRKADVVLRQLISVGLKNSASDIHIENTDRRLNVRFRIDGVLQQIFLGYLDEELNRLKRQIVSRIKVLGNLDIAERRRPQDGSFRVRLLRGGRVVKIDFRISIISGYYGENVVLRVLDGSKAPKSIDDVGFAERIVQSYHQLLKRNTGILLITGPTGCGKSTTLYGALMTCYRPGIKILTAEDPIEYVYNNITQCEINPKIGNTFAKFIRAFLRQDPEVIMVGEIRDAETAEMAFRAAQTGHLVLSTLHTNDAVSSITRLLDLNVDSSLIGSCLLGVLSQRLVRRICAHCGRAYRPSKVLLREFFDTPPAGMKWLKGTGCSHCNHTGYNGRLAVAELWTPSDNDFILINKRAGIDELRHSACGSTIFMAEDAMEKLRAGKTNLEELMRTLPSSSISRFRGIPDSFQAGERQPGYPEVQ